MAFIKTGLTVIILTWISAFAFRKSLDITSGALVETTKKTSLLTDREVAMRYCQSCHLFPEPSLMDKKTWTSGVLPNMALRMGIHEAGKDPYEGLPEAEKILMRKLNVYPEVPTLSVEDWLHIVHFYETEAPSEPLPQKTTTPVSDSLPLFSAQHVAVGDKAVPKTTMLKYDATGRQLYVGDDQNILYVLDNQLFLKDSWWIDTAPTDIDFPKGAPARLLTIGHFGPSEQKQGRLMSLSKTAATTSLVNIRELPRPVQFATSDLNQDGKEDVVICGFGNNSGKLFWYDNFNPALEHILKPLPGARRVEIRDMNRDKKPDIVALMAQAREEISIFYNLGNGQFKEKVLLRFPPSYGMSYFELLDFNNDGFQDILLTNGDNWDYSAVDKNYHGIRLYLNDGKDNFREAWFYPLHGASKAIARDFDQDGDMDIAATSFYSDLNNPAHTFVYLSNEGKMNFSAHATPLAAYGKWLTMEAADLDQDGDLDIVLGSYFHTVGEMSRLIFKGILSFPQLLVLTNQKK